MDPSKNWIRLNRSLLTNTLWRLEPFTKGQAWVDMLLLANHSEGFISPRGVVTVIRRGQVGMSELQLAIRWQWSRTKVKKFLDLLEKEHQIKQHRDNVSLVVTIVNYDLYQGDEQQKEQQKDTRNAAEEHQKSSSETPEVQQKSTNKNDKKKKKKEDVSDFEKEALDFFEQAWSLYPRKIGKDDARRHFLNSVKTDHDIDLINLALEEYLLNVKDTDIKYIKHGSAWFHQWRNWIPEGTTDAA